MKPGFGDYQTHSIRRSRNKASRIHGMDSRLKQHRLSIQRNDKTSTVTLAPPGPPLPVATTSFRSVGRVAEIRVVLDFLCQYFHQNSPENMVESALALYERNIHIYERKYVAKKEIWAAACYFVDAERRKSRFTYKEIAAAFLDPSTQTSYVEPKQICKIAGYIKKHEAENFHYVSQREDGGLSRGGNCGNLEAVSRLAWGFGMNFRQEKIALKIVGFIDKEELISGLNPLSILSVSFFLTFSLSMNIKQFKQDVPTFIKRTLREVSKQLHIATNTIRKGIREVRAEVLDMVHKERKKLKVDERVIRLVRSWEL